MTGQSLGTRKEKTYVAMLCGPVPHPGRAPDRDRLRPGRRHRPPERGGATPNSETAFVRTGGTRDRRTEDLADVTTTADAVRLQAAITTARRDRAG